MTPDGTVLPCQSARVIPELTFPKVSEHSLAWIWHESPLFNAFRGSDWMQEPCRSCPEKTKDLGGCRCQAYMLTGDARATDPVCSLSPRHAVVLDAVAQANRPKASDTQVQPLLFRTPRNAKQLVNSGTE